MVLHKIPSSTMPSNAANVDGDDEHGSQHSGSNSSDDDDEDEAYSDWVSDSQNVACRSLFDEKTFPTVQAALEYDKTVHGYDLEGVCKGLGLDFHGRARLINYVRKEKPSPQSLGKITGKEPFFGDDAYLKPVIEDDPLLQTGTDDWSDDEDDDLSADTRNLAISDSPEALKRSVHILQKQLAKARQDLHDYQSLVEARFNLFRERDGAAATSTASNPDPETDTPLQKLVEEARLEASLPLKAVAERAASQRDDDTHYFDSYALVDIHYTMLRDTIRTSTYASFILSTPALFKDAVVLDVGCGTGILSLFAARAGARRVIAVDASGVAEKARRIVEGMGLGDVITVIKGKVEDISLPDGLAHVDVIVSEWMGYALLYESMLDSVLVARDRFLRPPNPSLPPLPAPTPFVPQENEADAAREERELREEREEEARIRVERERRGGVMAPSQCRIVLGMCEAAEAWKERVEFWEDVYGYDMSVMAEEVYDEAIVDIITPESVLTSTDIINDIHTSTTPLTPTPSTFSSPFTLTSTSPRRRLARAFVLYFDTFFAPDGRKVPPEVHAKEVREGEGVVREVWRVGRSGGGSRGTSPEPERSGESAVTSPTDETPRSPGILRKDSTAQSSKRRRSVSRKRSSTNPSRVSFDASGGDKETQKALEAEFEGLYSFTTGPQSEPTHWKQTLFLLREAAMLEEGSKISGTFHCRRSADNSRELDVEIHYSIEHPPGSKSEAKSGKGKGEVVVQSFKVR